MWIFTRSSNLSYSDFFSSSSELKGAICVAGLYWLLGSSETFSPFHTAFMHLYRSPSITILEGVYSCPMSIWVTLYLQLKKLSSNRHPSINVVPCDSSWEGLTLQCYYGYSSHGEKEHFFVYTSNSEVIHFCLSCTIAWLTDPQSSYSWHGDYRIIVLWVSTW